MIVTGSLKCRTVVKTGMDDQESLAEVIDEVERRRQVNRLTRELLDCSPDLNAG